MQYRFETVIVICKYSNEACYLQSTRVYTYTYNNIYSQSYRFEIDEVFLLPSLQKYPT